jgi:Mrp family chromosome partitioning ATPase/capsular polysaccharide biosynthesis protein
VIDVSARARSPHQAKAISDAIVAAYLADQIEANRLTTRQAKDALASRLELLRADLRHAEERVQSYRVANGIVGAQGNLVSEQQLAELNLRLVQARARLVEAQSRFDQTQRLARSGADASSVGEALASTVVTNLRTQLAEIKRREAELSSTLGSRHPSLLEVRAQLSNAQRLIDEEIQRISRSVASELAVARGSEKALSNELKRLSDRSQSTDSSLIALRDLERDADASRKLYEAFLTRAKQTAEQERIETAAARVLAPAEIPIGSSYPPHGLLLILALVLGLGLGATSALLREHLDDTVRSAAQLRELTGLRVFVSGPERDKVTFTRWLSGDGLRGQQLQSDTRSEDHVAASAGAGVAARALRHILHEGIERAGPRTVMVVSTREGEGTANFALSLALATSLNGKRVLIVDADTERRTLTQLVAPEAQMGIFDVIMEKLPLASVAIANSGTGLSFLPMPAMAQASAKGITRDQLSVLFAIACTEFDCIILCGAPLLAEPDTGNLCQSVDQIVLVTRAGVSRRDEVQDALQLLRIHHCKPHSAVLTVEVDSDIT